MKINYVASFRARVNKKKKKVKQLTRARSRWVDRTKNKDNGLDDLEQVFPNLRQCDYSKKVPHLYEIFVERIVALPWRTREDFSEEKAPKSPKGIDVHLNLPRPIKVKRFVSTNQSEESSRGGLFEAWITQTASRFTTIKEGLRIAGFLLGFWLRISTDFLEDG